MNTWHLVVDSTSLCYPDKRWHEISRTQVPRVEALQLVPERKGSLYLHHHMRRANCGLTMKRCHVHLRCANPLLLLLPQNHVATGPNSDEPPILLNTGYGKGDDLSTNRQVTTRG
jgi:hypothetical protein